MTDADKYGGIPSFVVASMEVADFEALVRDAEEQETATTCEGCQAKPKDDSDRRWKHLGLVLCGACLERSPIPETT